MAGAGGHRRHLSGAGHPLRKPDSPPHRAHHKEHPAAKILAHPECKGPVINIADKVGSTAALLKYSIVDEAQEFIVATEKRYPERDEEVGSAEDFYPCSTRRQHLCLQ